MGYQQGKKSGWVVVRSKPLEDHAWFDFAAQIPKERLVSSQNFGLFFSNFHSFGNSSTKQVHESKKQIPVSKTNTLSFQNNSFRSNTNSSRSTKTITARSREHKCKSSTFFATPGPKEIWPGPKNM